MKTQKNITQEYLLNTLSWHSNYYYSKLYSQFEVHAFIFNVEVTWTQRTYWLGNVCEKNMYFVMSPAAAAVDDDCPQLSCT